MAVPKHEKDQQKSATAGAQTVTQYIILSDVLRMCAGPGSLLQHAADVLRVQASAATLLLMHATTCSPSTPVLVRGQNCSGCSTRQLTLIARERSNCQGLVCGEVVGVLRSLEASPCQAGVTAGWLRESVS